MNNFSKTKSDGNVCTDIFVGMDLHKSYLQVAVLDGKGKVLKNLRVHNHLSKVERFFERICGSGNSRCNLLRRIVNFSLQLCVKSAILDPTPNLAAVPQTRCRY